MRIVHIEPATPPPTRREQIVAAARSLFARHGYEGTSIAAIARAVGVADGAIYRHFESKRDILHAVIAGFYEPLVAEADRAVGEITDPRDRLRILVRRNLTAYADDPLVCRLIIAEARVLDGYYESTIADLSRRYTALAVDAVRDGIALGIFRADVAPTVVRDVLFGAMEHLAWATLTGHGSIDIDGATTTLIDLVLEGIAAPREEPVRLGDQLDRLESLVDRFETTGGRR